MDIQSTEHVDDTQEVVEGEMTLDEVEDVAGGGDAAPVGIVPHR